jgi:predicted ATPase/transcriptional regulator with XRE-family HTH domain
MQTDVDRGLFGPVLRRLRLEARISQEELAERAHLSVESISALERGRRRAPYRETIRLLSDALGLSKRQREELEAAGKRPRLSSAAVTLYDSGDPDVPPASVPRRIDESRHNLPLARSSLIGRGTEIAEIVRMLADRRVVTVTGAGGIGKTRAAIAVGEALLDDTADGVWLIELAPLAQGSFLLSAVARVLNVQESPTRPLLETLLAYLKGKSLLLILDNCEHVIAEAAVLADTLRGGCPQLRILATSREPLRISGEYTYRLPSLCVEAAMRLFAQRAQGSDHEFAIGEENAPIVAEICQRLDGIPLAIELAAARVNALSLQVLSTRLDHRLRILTGGDRTALPRQQTMRALIDWSYDLLSRPEQQLFERLSIFAGGCTLASIAAVSADDAVDEIGVLELLSSLVDKSLVVADLDVPEPRYRLLESSRQYAYEKLAVRGEAQTLARRHALAYAELAERLEREHDVERNSIWFARAGLEIENWRAALHWALVERGDPVLGQRLAGAMRAVWPVSAIAERRRWLETALASVDERTPPLVAANLQHSVATTAYLFGEFQAALTISRRLILDYGDLGDALGTARAQFLAGRSLANLGQVADGETLLQRSLQAARLLDNTPLAGLALAGLARIRSVAGDFAAARAHLTEAFALYEATGADAYSVLVQSAAAGIEFAAGDVERAVKFCTSAVAAMREFGLTLFLTMELNNLAGYLTASGRWTQARASAREALALARDTQQLAEVAWSLQHLAAIAALSAEDSRRAAAGAVIAARVFGYVDARIAALGSSRQYLAQREYVRVTTLLRESMDAGRFEEWSASGAALTEEQIVELVR